MHYLKHDVMIQTISLRGKLDPSPVRVFSTVSFGGEIAFVGRSNVKNIQNTNKVCLCFGCVYINCVWEKIMRKWRGGEWEILNLGEGISLKKETLQ